MVLKGSMIIIAVSLLTIFHHGFAFGGDWSAASWSLRKLKSKVEFALKEVSCELQDAKDRTVLGTSHVRGPAQHYIEGQIKRDKAGFLLVSKIHIRITHFTLPTTDGIFLCNLVCLDGSPFIW